MPRNISGSALSGGSNNVTSNNRTTIHSTKGDEIPPPDYLTDASHPLLRDLDTRAEALLLNVQDPSTLLSVANIEKEAMVGTLRAMCSRDEMIEKQATSTASDLERLRIPSDAEGRYINKHLAIKSFQRSDASKVFLPTDTRPVLWCRRTVHNLLILQLEADKRECPWLFKRDNDVGYRFMDVYNFIRDRLRGVWQDLTIQHCHTHRGTIESLEISCRFLLLSEELLCEEPEFDSVQNGALISTCLEKLMLSYHAVRQYRQSQDWQALQNRSNLSPIGMKLTESELKSLLDILGNLVQYTLYGLQHPGAVFESPFEAEFWAYRLLLCLSSGDRTPSICMGVISKINATMLGDNRVKLAFEAVRAFCEGNAARFFKLQFIAPYLLAIVMNKFGNLLRASLLRILSCDGIRKQSMGAVVPFKLFQRLFNLQDEVLSITVDFCDSNGITCIYESEADITPSHVDLTRMHPPELYRGEPKWKRFRNEQLRLREEVPTQGRFRVVDVRENLVSSSPRENDAQKKRESSLSTKLAALKKRFVKEEYRTENGMNSGACAKVLRENTMNDISQKRGSAGSMFSQGEPDSFPAHGGEPPDDARNRSNLFAMTQISTPEDLGPLRISPTKRRNDPPGKVAQRTSLEATSSSSIRLSRPFGAIDDNVPATSEKGDYTDDESMRLPRFGAGSDLSEPDSFNEIQTFKGKRREKRRLAGENEEHAMPREVTPSCKKKSKFMGDLGSHANHEEDDTGREETFPSSTRHRSSAENEAYCMSDAGATSPLVITPYHSDLFRHDQELQQSLKDFRGKIGLSLDAILQTASFMSRDSVYKDLAKQMENCRWTLESYDSSIAKHAIRHLGAFTDVGSTRLEPKLVSWHICCWNDNSLSGLILDAILHGVLWRKTSMQSFDKSLEGSLSMWSGGKAVSVETSDSYHNSKWLKESRALSSVAIECTSIYRCGTKIRSLVRKNPQPKIFLWHCQQAVLVRPALLNLARPFCLEKGLSKRFRLELSRICKEISIAGLDTIRNDCIVLLFDVIVTSSLNWTYDRVASTPGRMEIADSLAEIITKKMNSVIEKNLQDPTLTSEGTVKVLQHIQHQYKVSLKPYAQPLSISWDRINFSSENDEKPEVILSARDYMRKRPSSGSDERGRLSSKSRISAVRAASWSCSSKCIRDSELPITDKFSLFLIRGFAKALEFPVSRFSNEMMWLTQNNPTADLTILCYPVSIVWQRKVTDRVPFVLLNIWRRQIYQLKEYSTENLLSALPRGMESFLNNPLWYIVRDDIPEKIRAVLSNAASSEDSSSGKSERDEYINTVASENEGRNNSQGQQPHEKRSVLSDLPLIKKYFARLLKIFVKVQGIPEIMTQISENAINEESGSSTNLSPKKSCENLQIFQVSRRIIRLLIKYVLESLSWGREPKGFLLETVLKIPLPLYLYVIKSENVATLDIQNDIRTRTKNRQGTFTNL